MIDCIDETFRRKQVGFGVNVILQGQHVGGRKPATRFQYVVDTRGAPRSFPFHADGVRIAVGRDPAIRGGDDSR